MYPLYFAKLTYLRVLSGIKLSINFCFDFSRVCCQLYAEDLHIHCHVCILLGTIEYQIPVGSISTCYIFKPSLIYQQGWRSMPLWSIPCEGFERHIDEGYWCEQKHSLLHVSLLYLCSIALSWSRYLCLARRSEWMDSPIRSLLQWAWEFPRSAFSCIGLYDPSLSSFSRCVFVTPSTSVITWLK